MSCLCKSHQELTNGIGKCSVPMWMDGCPAGFCDKEAFGKRPAGEQYRSSSGEMMRIDGRYNGYVPALACPIHGGPTKEEALNLCQYCQNEIPSCSENPKFGTGTGKDNVYECDGFIPKNANNEHETRE